MKNIIRYFKNKKSFIQTQDFKSICVGTLIGVFSCYFLLGSALKPGDYPVFFGFMTTMFFLTTAIVEVLSFKSYSHETEHIDVSLSKAGYLNEQDKYIVYDEIKEKFKDSPTKILMLEKEIFDTKNVSIKEINKKVNQIENIKLN